MRSFAISLVAVGLVFLAFLISVSARSPAFMLVWLCLSPVAYIALGYTLHTARLSRRRQVSE
ncbi:hypothetical protein ANRL2_01099 [Anaerolineae bacterium]|nr:hypothetical protein ANRL2_01099 [Anaerolineae bacterium]